MKKKQKVKQKGKGVFRGTNRQRGLKQKGGVLRKQSRRLRKKNKKCAGFGIGMAAGMALPLLTGFLSKNRKLGFGSAPPPPPQQKQQQQGPPPGYGGGYYYPPPPRHYYYPPTPHYSQAPRRKQHK